MMRAGTILLVAFLAACARPIGGAAVLPVPATDHVADAAATISERDVHGRIAFLASDALRGRDTPSQGLEAAAAWIGSEFLRLGVRPAGTDGYLQRWPYETIALDAAGTHLEFRTPAGLRAPRVGVDYYVAAGTAAPFTGGVVFTGRGLPAEEVREQALRDRLVAVYMPELVQQTVFATRGGADAAGAAGLLIILGPAVTEAEVARAAAAAERVGRAAPRLPLFFLRHDRAAEVFRDAGLDFHALSADTRLRPVALTGVNARAGAPITRVVHQPPNVAGMIVGSDSVLRSTFVVVSAHFDHVGVAGEGSRQCPPAGDNIICNGADDNGSGTAALLELAQAWAALPEPPRRSIIFLAVSGEEKGLLGSAYYADNPTVPIESIVANINIDMIGRNHPDSVVVIGQTYSSLGPLLHTVNARVPELGLTVSDDLWPEQRFFFRSDHFSFARREIPAIFFFTGVHEDYHRPTDTVEKIDFSKVARITRLIFHYALAIANDPQPPRWDPDGLDEVRRLTQGR